MRSRAIRLCSAGKYHCNPVRHNSLQRLLPISFSLIALGGGTAACNASPYAAVVNGTPISQRSFNAVLSAIKGNSAYMAQIQQSAPVTGSGPGSFNVHFVDQALYEQISLGLVHQEIVRRHLKISPSDLSAARSAAIGTFGGPAVFSAFPKWYQTQLTSQFAQVTTLEASVAHIGLASPALHKYYAAHSASFEKICTSHIVSTTQSSAASVKAKVTGGMPFANAAQTYSTDHQSAVVGGKLGCGLQAQYSQVIGPAVGALVAGLPVGAVGGPIQTQAGWELFQITSKSRESFAQAVPAVRSQLLSGAAPTFSKYLTGLLNSAKIKVNPLYGTFESVHGQTNIVAPKTPPASATGSAPLSGSGPAGPGGPASGTPTG